MTQEMAQKMAQENAVQKNAAAHSHGNPGDLLHLRFIRMAKRNWFSFAMADTTGKKLTYGKTLIGGMILARWLRGHCSGKESIVGIMLPASVGGALANVAVLLAGKTPVNLNFTAGKEAIQSAIEQCSIGTILTSRVFLTKAKLERIDGMVMLEDLMGRITSWQKIRTALAAFLLPTWVLQRLHNSGQAATEALATVAFSSGSTGEPKGIMLTHRNILSNIEAMHQLFPLTSQDCIAGVLPFFHCFGFTCTLWFPLLTGAGVAYHPNPLDAKAVGELVFEHKATFMVGTATFCNGYTRRCSREEFASLRHVIVGAEKLQEPVARAFREKFGVDLLEGYGCTEMSPVVSVNVPGGGLKPGTIGRPLPGVSAKVVDRETGKPLPCNQEGLLLVNGPNRMAGYWGQPEKTAEVFRDGWYVTGDIAAIDEEGFLRITDRLSRFSKIGGEMVPYIKVEEAINRILGDSCCAVTGIPDPQKGERLVVLYTRSDVAPEKLREQLLQTDLPRLWIPKRESFYCVEALPTLGIGKTDLRQVKILAVQLSQA